MLLKFSAEFKKVVVVPPRSSSVPGDERTTLRTFSRNPVTDAAAGAADNVIALPEFGRPTVLSARLKVALGRIVVEPPLMTLITLCRMFNVPFAGHVLPDMSSSVATVDCSMLTDSAAVALAVAIPDGVPQKDGFSCSDPTVTFRKTMPPVGWSAAKGHSSLTVVHWTCSMVLKYKLPKCPVLFGVHRNSRPLPPNASDPLIPRPTKAI